MGTVLLRLCPLYCSCRHLQKPLSPPCHKTCSCRVPSWYSSYCESFSCQSLIEVTLSFWFCILLPTLLNSTIMYTDPGKLVIGTVIGSHISSLSNLRKVTPPYEELITILPSPFVLHYTNKVVCVQSWLTDFSKEFVLMCVTWDFSPTDFPPTCGGTLDFLSVSPSDTHPFPRFVRMTTHDVCLPPELSPLVFWLMTGSRPRNVLLGKGYVSCRDENEWATFWIMTRMCLQLKAKISKGTKYERIKVNNTKLNVTTFDFFPIDTSVCDPHTFPRDPICGYIYIGWWSRDVLFNLMFGNSIFSLFLSGSFYRLSQTLSVHLIQCHIGYTGASVDFMYAICP